MDTNIEFVLRGLEGSGDRRLIITKEAALALAIGCEIVIDGGTYEFVRIITYLRTTTSNCYLSDSFPIMEVRPVKRNGV